MAAQSSAPPILEQSYKKIPASKPVAVSELHNGFTAD
jgi:hypothetical protein